MNNLETQCQGCTIELTSEKVSGYRRYCNKCVDVILPMPKDGRGYNIEGKYPNFKWVSYESIV